MTLGTSETRRQRRFWSPGVAGLVGTLLVHVLALQAVLLGTQAKKVRPPEVQGPGAILVKSDSAPAESLMLLELPSAVMASKPLLEDVASADAAPKNLMVTMIGPDPLRPIEIFQNAAGDDHDAVAGVASGDPVARAVLFGRYTGQIDARIERAWRRPRSPVNPDSNPLHDMNARQPNDATHADDTFRCQVRIIQDERGSVQEVHLLHCNGTVAWQQSLVAAILSASPLPAPPSPTVFTNALTMTFLGYAYTPGSSTEEYALEDTPFQAQNRMYPSASAVPAALRQPMVAEPRGPSMEEGMQPAPTVVDERSGAPVEP